MTREDEFFQTHTKGEIWQRYCGFLDLSLEDFMNIQENLLMEQIDLVGDSTLGKKIMNDWKPKTVEEFREVVPLTTYQDYEPYLGERREDALHEKPAFWAHSSGRGGYFKWVPYTDRFYRRIVDHAIGGLILACAKSKGEVNLVGDEKIIFNLAPRPYVSGFIGNGISKRERFRFLPPPEVAEKMDFQQRTEESFKMGLHEGVDVVGSLSSVLVKVGERFTGNTKGMRFSASMLHPAVLWRLSKALLQSKIQRRPLLPKDLWPLKGALCSGTDTAIYKDQVRYYWGITPWELYGPTEAGILAMQGWSKNAMSFTPFSSFLEFVPQEEWLKSKEDSEYQPSTVLINELREGNVYEVITTSFYGVPFLRYRPGDLVEVVALSDEENGIKLPQIAFKSRADSLIDLAGLARLDERTVWRAIHNTGIQYEEWSARKEYDHNQSYLRIYLELKQSQEPQEIEQMIDVELNTIDVDYRDIDSWLGLHPIRVTLLSPGTFQRFYQERQREGADLAHLKPPRMNASDEVIQTLINLSE